MRAGLFFVFFNCVWWFWITNFRTLPRSCKALAELNNQLLFSLSYIKKPSQPLKCLKRNRIIQKKKPNQNRSHNMMSDVLKHSLYLQVYGPFTWGGFHHSNAYCTGQPLLNMSNTPAPHDPPPSITHAFFDWPTFYDEGKSRLNSAPLAEVLWKKAAGSK